MAAFRVGDTVRLRMKGGSKVHMTVTAVDPDGVAEPQVETRWWAPNCSNFFKATWPAHRLEYVTAPGAREELERELEGL